MSNITDIANDWIREIEDIDALRDSFRKNASHLSDCFVDTTDWATGETFTASELEEEIVRIVMEGQEW